MQVIFQILCKKWWKKKQRMLQRVYGASHRDASKDAVSSKQERLCC